MQSRGKPTAFSHCFPRCLSASPTKMACTDVQNLFFPIFDRKMWRTPPFAGLWTVENGGMCEKFFTMRYHGRGSVKCSEKQKITRFFPDFSLLEKRRNKEKNQCKTDVSSKCVFFVLQNVIACRLFFNKGEKTPWSRFFSTNSTEFSTNAAWAKHGIHIVLHTAVEKRVENQEYSLYIVENFSP